MNSSILVFVLALLVVALAGSYQVQAVVIGFEPLRVEDDQAHNWGAVYDESGFRVSGSTNGGMYTYGTTSHNFEGSTALINGESGRASNANTRLTLTAIGGESFDLESLDIAPESSFSSSRQPQFYIVASNAEGFISSCRIAITNQGTGFFTIPLGLENLMSASWCGDQTTHPANTNRTICPVITDNIVVNEPGHKENLFYRVVSTQPTEVVALGTDGRLVWTNTVSNAPCRIEALRSLVENTNPRLLTAEFPADGLQSWIRMPPGEAETPIVLSVYSDGGGDLLERRAVPASTPVLIWIFEADPYDDPPQYYAYARCANSYTELYRFTNSWATEIVPDSVPDFPFSMTGAIFGMQRWYAHHPLASYPLSVTGPSGPLPDTATDMLGRYYLTNEIPGTYTLGFTYQDVAFSFQLTNTPDVDYQDLYFWNPLQALAPNIYLYPETESQVQVTLGFPNGGHVSLSEPAYSNGWNVTAAPNGIIDGRHPYLFYESVVPIPTETETGWLLDGDNLEGELRDLLANLGFVDREIDDFIAYWLPRLKGQRWYAVYVQQPEMMSTLHITPKPQGVLRALFTFRALKHPISIPTPKVSPFIRSGFTVVEWGVLGWNE